MAQKNLDDMFYFFRWLQDVNTAGALRGTAPEGKGRAGETTTPPHLRQNNKQITSPVVGAALLVGMPVITSPGGLRFWLELCGLGSRREICTEAFKAFGHSTAARLSHCTEKDPVATPTLVRLDRRGADTSIGKYDEMDNKRLGGRRKRGFAASETSGNDPREETPEASPYYGRAWFETTISKLRDLDGLGVAGVHLMAPGQGPRRRVRELLNTGFFGP